MSTRSHTIGTEKCNTSAWLFKGPAGFVARCGAIIYGATSLITGRFLLAVLGAFGGALLFKADAITSSLGLTF